jgi:deoxyribonuclease-4
MSIAGGPVRALERGRSIACSAIQLFVKNNMQWFAKPFAVAELEAFRSFADPPLVAFGHTSYLINPGANNVEILENSVRSLEQELGRAHELRLPFLVLHPGAHLGDGERAGLDRIVGCLDLVFSRLSRENKVRIALEITAGQGSSLGHKFSQLADIIENSRHGHRLAVCLDTAHLFAAGYDISTEKGFWKTIEKFDREIGLDRLAAWHLNDSKTKLGSRVDRHEHIGRGAIGLAPFREIMRAAAFANVPKVLETPKGPDLAEDVENLTILRGLVEE